MESENKTLLGYRWISVKKQEKKHQKVSWVHTDNNATYYNLPITRNLAIEQSKVALDFKTICKRLFILNISVRMLKTEQQMSSHQNDKKEKHNLYILILFQTFIIIQVSLMSKTIQSTLLKWI